MSFVIGGVVLNSILQRLNTGDIDISTNSGFQINGIDLADIFAGFDGNTENSILQIDSNLSGDFFAADGTDISVFFNKSGKSVTKIDITSSLPYNGYQQLPKFKTVPSNSVLEGNIQLKARTGNPSINQGTYYAYDYDVSSSPVNYDISSNRDISGIFIITANRISYNITSHKTYNNQRQKPSDISTNVLPFDPIYGQIGLVVSYNVGFPKNVGSYPYTDFSYSVYPVNTNGNYLLGDISGTFIIDPVSINFDISGSSVYNNSYQKPNNNYSLVTNPSAYYSDMSFNIKFKSTNSLLQPKKVGNYDYSNNYVIEFLGDGSGNYNVGTVINNFKITPFPVTFDISGSKYYNAAGQLPDVSTNCPYSDLSFNINFKNLNPLQQPTALASYDYSNNYIISLTGDSSSNYIIQNVIGTFRITKRPIDFDISGVTVYNHYPQKPIPRLIGQTFSDLSYNLAIRTGISSENVGSYDYSNNYQISLLGPGSSNYSVGNVINNFRITPKPIDYDISGSTTYNSYGQAPISRITSSLSMPLYSDISYNTVVRSDASSVNVGRYDYSNNYLIQFIGDTSNNYMVGNVINDFSINPLPITVDISSSKMYTGYQLYPTPIIRAKIPPASIPAGVNVNDILSISAANGLIAKDVNSSGYSKVYFNISVQPSNNNYVILNSITDISGIFTIIPQIITLDISGVDIYDGLVHYPKIIMSPYDISLNITPGVTIAKTYRPNEFNIISSTNNYSLIINPYSYYEIQPLKVIVYISGSTTYDGTNQESMLLNLITATTNPPGYEGFLNKRSKNAQLINSDNYTANTILDISFNNSNYIVQDISGYFRINPYGISVDISGVTQYNGMQQLPIPTTSTPNIYFNVVPNPISGFLKLSTDVNSYPPSYYTITISGSNNIYNPINYIIISYSQTFYKIIKKPVYFDLSYSAIFNNTQQLPPNIALLGSDMLTFTANPGVSLNAGLYTLQNYTATFPSNDYGIYNYEIASTSSLKFNIQPIRIDISLNGTTQDFTGSSLYAFSLLTIRPPGIITSSIITPKAGTFVYPGTYYVSDLSINLSSNYNIVGYGSFNIATISLPFTSGTNGPLPFSLTGYYYENSTYRSTYLGYTQFVVSFNNDSRLNRNAIFYFTFTSSVEPNDFTRLQLNAANAFNATTSSNDMIYMANFYYSMTSNIYKSVTGTIYLSFNPNNKICTFSYLFNGGSFGPIYVTFPPK